jgi:LmbE family N-acetylglucosaminyl deacetylase
VEFGMMGTVLKYTDTIFNILCLSQGGDFDQTTSKSRLEEIKNVWGNHPNVNLFFVDNKFIDDLKHDAWVNYIETKFLDKEEYDCLFIPTNRDSHFEHKKVSQLAAPLTRVKNISILEYRTPSTLDSWLPNTFVDITDFFDEKYNRLMRFVSQNQRWYFKKELLKSFHSNFQSYKKGIKYTEKFKLIQLYKI